MSLSSASPSTPLHSWRQRFALPDVPAPFGTALLAAMVLFLCVAWPIRVPLFLGMVAAITSRPLFDRLNKLFGGRRAAAAGIMSLLLLAAVVLPSIGIITACVGQAREVLAWAMVRLEVDGSNPSFDSGMEHLAIRLATALHVDLAAVKTALQNVMQKLYSESSTLAMLPLVAIGNTLMLLIAHFFFAADGHHVANYLGRVVPLRPEQTSELLEEFHNVTRGAVWSSACNGVGQGVIMYIGLAVAGVPHPVLLGIVASFTALIPLVGSLLVWGPSVAYLIVNGHGGWAAILGAWCFIMVTLVDNTIKPWILRGKVEFHGGLLLMGFVGGVGLFGATGLVAGPLVVAFLLTMLRIYQRDYLNQQVVVAS